MANLTAAAPPERRSGRALSGEPGIWLFIFGDLAVFTGLFLIYLWYRSTEAEIFAVAQQSLNADTGMINTVVLLTSSLFVASAVRAIRASAGVIASRLIVATMLCGAVFVVIKLYEYSTKLSAGQAPDSDGFFFFYFFITGLHLVHVLIGLGALIFMWSLARHSDQLSPAGRSAVESCACFWHLVDLLWIVIFPLLYLI